MTAWYIDAYIHIFKKQKQKRIPWDSTWTGLCCLNGEQGCFSLVLPRSTPGRCMVSSSLSSMVELGASAQTPKLNFLENINLGPKFWIWSSNVDVQFYLVLCRWFLFLSGTSKSSTIIMFIIVMFIFMFLFQQTQSRGNSYSVKSSDIILCTSFIKLKYVSVLWMSLSLVYHLKLHRPTQCPYLPSWNISPCSVSFLFSLLIFPPFPNSLPPLRYRPD